jgi:hypothetical protein
MAPTLHIAASRSQGARAMAVALLLTSTVCAKTPELNIRTKNGLLRIEEQRKQQMLQLANLYDLSKYTITSEIVIDRGAMNHSFPVLTMNPRFLDDDDLALSEYIHEQGHWLLMRRSQPENQSLLKEMQQAFSDLHYHWPKGDGEAPGGYFHIAVYMLEWQAMEELVGAKRAQRVIQWKQRDHYTAVYAILLQQRSQVEEILNRAGVKW